MSQPNVPTSQNFGFDVELSLNAASLTGSAVLIGTLSNNPVMIMFKNQTNQIVFLADNSGSTNGTTMAVGEEIILDCRANRGLAPNGSFPANTSFFATGPTGTGVFKISVIYAY